MSDFCIPIVHVEGNIDHKEYGITDLSDAIYFVQAFASNIFQECFILFAVENSILQPIHMETRRTLTAPPFTGFFETLICNVCLILSPPLSEGLYFDALHYTEIWRAV